MNIETIKETREVLASARLQVLTEIELLQQELSDLDSTEEALDDALVLKIIA